MILRYGRADQAMSQKRMAPAGHHRAAVPMCLSGRSDRPSKPSAAEFFPDY